MLKQRRRQRQGRGPGAGSSPGSFTAAGREAGTLSLAGPCPVPEPREEAGRSAERQVRSRLGAQRERRASHRESWGELGEPFQC